MRKLLYRCVALLLLAVCLGMLASPMRVYAANTVVRVGCFPLNGFYDFSKDGSMSGYGTEITDTMLGYAGWDYEYVRYASWVEALDALSKSEIDLLAPAQHTPERDAIYAFDSFPIGTEYGALVSLSTNDKLVYEDYAEFDGLHVGCVASLVFLDDFDVYESRNGFSVDMDYYKDTAALVAALNAGEVEAILVNMMVKTDSMKLLARFGAAPIYYMLSPKASGLKESLNHVIDNVSSYYPRLQNDLSAKYFSGFDKIPFSKEEYDYIANVGVLNVACNVQNAPFSYVDSKSNQISGVDRALLEKISEISGLRFSYKPFDSDTDRSEYFKSNDIAIFAGVENDENTHRISSDFSEAYRDSAKYFVGTKDDSMDTDARKKVAVTNTAAAQCKHWEIQYPNFEFASYASAELCAEAVRSGEADYLLEDRYTVENLLAVPKNNMLQILPSEAHVSEFCFQITASDKDAQLLISILNKSIRELSDTDVETCISEYAQKNRYQYTISDFLYKYRVVISAVSFLLAVVIVAIVFVYRARRKSQRKTEESEIKLRNITNNINGGVVVLRANGGLNITYANDGFLELIGCTREEFEYQNNGSYLAYVHPDDLSKVKEEIESSRNELSLKLRVQRHDGAYIPVLFNCTVGREKDGCKELYCVILDMTEQDRLMEQLRIDKRRTDLILDRVQEVFYEVNLVEHTITTSNSFIEELGWTLPDRLPDSVDDYFVKMWLTDAQSVDKIRSSTREMLAKKEPTSVIVRLESKKNERLIWCEIFQHPILSTDGAVVSVIGFIRNVDEQISERERLIEQARHDPLTGLYNKEAFELLVTETLVKMPEKNHALVFIDMDYFKSLNDTLGHMVGDRAICEAADKLRVIFSNYDILARFGGDEFCAFVKNIPVETLCQKMEWLVDKMRADYSGEKGIVHITCSCGVACTKERKSEYKNLMKNADHALYCSKEAGRDRYTFFAD